MNTGSDERRASALTLLRSTALLAAAVFLGGLWYAPGRAWASFLVAFVLYVGLALAGPFFLALLALSGARWPGELRRIPEAATAALPLGALLGVVLLSGIGPLYEWAHPEIVAHDPLLQHKAPYLNPLGFGLRLAACFALWILLARGLTRALRAHEEQPAPGSWPRALRRAALFVAVFALTFSVASVDWVESLEPHWSSTLFALIVLSNVTLAALAAFVLIAARGTRWLTRERCDDVGRLFIGLSLFWAYIAYCQHALIWYTNMPEETSWYVARETGEWPTVAHAATALCWLVPFLVLMPRAFRRKRVVLVRVSAAVLVGCVLRGFYLVAPALHGTHVGLGPLEIALPLGALCAFAWCTLRALDSHGASPGPEAPAAGHSPGLAPLRSVRCNQEPRH